MKKKFRVSLLLVSQLLCGPSLLGAQEVPHHQFLVKLDEPRKCLTCHDGVISPNISPCTTDCAINPSASHPVFKQYPPAGKESEFHPRAQVEAAGLNLQNNEVTCISCHNLMIKEKHHLIIGEARSRLCMTCHKR